MIHLAFDMTGKPAESVAALRQDLAVWAPTIAFAGNTMNVSCNFTQLNNILRASEMTNHFQAIGGPVIDANKMEELVDRYGTREYRDAVFARDVLEDAREELRAVAYQDVAGGPSDDDLDGPPGTALADAVDDHDAICLGRDHSEASSLAALGEALDAGSAQMLFLEEFQIELQADINLYLSDATADPDDFPPKLRARIDAIKAQFVADWEPILKKAKEKKICIYGIDSEAARELEVQQAEIFGEQRDVMMNAVVKQVMEQAIADNQDDDGHTVPYIAVVGAKHSNTHPGGIPGVSQMFGIPAIRMQGDRLVLDPEDQTQRGMLSRDEQAYVDKKLAKSNQSGELNPMNGAAIRAAAVQEATQLSAAGTLPSAEDSLLEERYLARADRLNKADIMMGNFDMKNAELAFVKLLYDQKQALLAEIARLTADIDLNMAAFQGQVPPPADAADLTTRRLAANAVNANSGIAQLTEVVDSLEFVAARIAGTRADDEQPEPKSVAEFTAARAIARTDKDDLVAQADLAKSQWQALEMDIRAGNTVDVLQYLAAAPYLADVRDENGRTLLHIAAEAENSASITALAAAYPAMVDQPDADGNTPLHLACKMRHVEAERAPYSVDDQAAMARQDAAVQALMAAGADIDAQNGDGSTPLHLTALSYNTDVLDRLFVANADVTLTDDRGWTALDTSIAATSSDIEAKFYADGKAQAGPVIPIGGTGSTIDILCAATLCENPAHAAQVRTAYEAAYAEPATRPLLELMALDAARPRNPPLGGNRIIVADGKNGESLIQRKDNVRPAQTYSGGYDHGTGVVHVAAGGSGDFTGVLLHELTHRSMHMVYGDDLAPYNTGDDVAKGAYVEAIEADVRRMATMIPASPMEARVKDRVMTRMDMYANQMGADGGDAALIQEFIVSIPQLIAEFGPDAVEEMVPRLYAQYEQVSTDLAAAKADARFDGERAKVDDSAVVVAAPVYAPNEDDLWVRPDNDALKPENLIKMIRTEYCVEHGEVDDTRLRDAPMVTPVGTMNPMTIVYDTSIYKLPDQAAVDALEAKLEKVQAALEAALSPELLTLAVSTEDIRDLITETTELAHATALNDIEKALKAKTDDWLLHAKQRRIDHKVAALDDGAGAPLSSVQLAEAVAIAAERDARGGDDYNIDTKEHATVVAKLKKFLESRPPGQEITSAADQDAFLNDAVARMTGGRKPAIEIKTGRKLFGTRDPAHVSIGKKKAKRAWIAAARALVG
ncbi:ankyrin repeat domain-containing protein [Sedimentitalea sp. HM32M-2]|uniref:ankyrin repeat domain-containing protein n=1 Tax=Sedimentitalea sp. HM32M-2 TaxID=3351566 RepID=UPI0036332CDE